MVLRGSAVVPDSLEDAQLAVERAEAILRRAKSQLEVAQQRAFRDFTEEEMRQLSKERLIQLVVDMREDLQELESDRLAAEKELTARKDAIVKTLCQLAAGGSAGAIARSTVAPIDRIKILMQTSAVVKGTEGKYTSMGGTLRHVLESEGVAGFWRGNLTNCVRVIPHTATQFVAYDKYKAMLVTEGKDVGMVQQTAQRLLTGALSGMTAATITHPLDVVRIRLQTTPGISTVGGAIADVFAENGLRSFYKGYTPAMLSLSPFIAINFATFDILKSAYYGDKVKSASKKELQQKNPGVILCLGAMSGLIAQSFCYPLDTVRRRMQVKGTNYSSTINAFTTIARTEGLGGFYIGMTANALKVAPNNAVRFAAFEVLKDKYLQMARNGVDLPWSSRPK